MVKIVDEGTVSEYCQVGECVVISTDSLELLCDVNRYLVREVVD
jgi:hypothetical protein